LPWTSPLLNSRPVSSIIKFQSLKEEYISPFIL
jgi:hypothetical protein